MKSINVIVINLFLSAPVAAEHPLTPSIDEQMSERLRAIRRDVESSNRRVLDHADHNNNVDSASAHPRQSRRETPSGSHSKTQRKGWKVSCDVCDATPPTAEK